MHVTKCSDTETLFMVLIHAHSRTHESLFSCKWGPPILSEIDKKYAFKGSLLIGKHSFRAFIQCGMSSVYRTWKDFLWSSTFVPLEPLPGYSTPSRDGCHKHSLYWLNISYLSIWRSLSHCLSMTNVWHYYIGRKVLPGLTEWIWCPHRS